MKIQEKDILTVDQGLIVQQVNRKGVMGKGLALQIAQKWPIVKQRYLEYCRSGRRIHLGDVFSVKVGPGLYVVNLFGQDDYGNSPEVCYTSYPALVDGFRKIAEVDGSHKIHIPFQLGCGNGGGNWTVVSALIEQILPSAIICRKPSTSVLAASRLSQNAII